MPSQLNFNAMPNSANSIISARVLFLLKERDMTQSKLAEMAEMEPGYLSELISGKKRWNTDHIDAIAKAFGVDAAHLMKKPEQEEIEKILDAAKQMPPDKQRIFMHMAEALLKGSDGQENNNNHTKQG